MIEDKKQTLKLSSKIACGPAFDSLAATKLSRYLLSLMMPVLQHSPNAEGRFDIEMIREALQYRADSHLQTAMKDIERHDVDWEAIVPTSVKWGVTYLFERCELDFRGDIHVKINPDLVPEIINPYSYKIIDLKKLLSFRSHYALRLYEFCHQYFMESENYGRTPNLLPDVLRQLVGCEEGVYVRAYDFIKNAITEPLKEISQLTPLRVYLRHDKRHVYSRRYWLEVSSLDLPGDPSLEKSTPEAEYTYLIQRLAAFASKYGNVPRSLFDQTVKSLDDLVLRPG